MRHRGYVDDLGNDDTSIVDGADCGLTASSRTLYVAFNPAKTCIESGLCSILSSHLGSVRGVLLVSPETTLAVRSLADDLVLGVGKGNDYILELL